MSTEREKFNRRDAEGAERTQRKDKECFLVKQREKTNHGELKRRSRSRSKEATGQAKKTSGIAAVAGHAAQTQDYTEGAEGSTGSPQEDFEHGSTETRKARRKHRAWFLVNEREKEMGKKVECGLFPFK